MSGRLDTALQALRWIATHETDEEAIESRVVCDDAFHVTRQGGERCPVCFSRWWATDGSLPGEEGSYALGAVAARALAEMGESEA